MLKININIKFLVILISFTPLHAYAYLDPGTGSVLIQALIAIIVTLGVYFRRFKVVLKDLLGKIKTFFIK